MIHAPRWPPSSVFGIVLLTASLSAQSGGFLVLQTNAAGDNIHLIDAATNKVVGRDHGIEVPHGARRRAGRQPLLLQQRAEHTLDVVDARR